MDRSSVIPYTGLFDGFHAMPATVSKACANGGAKFGHQFAGYDAEAKSDLGHQPSPFSDTNDHLGSTKR